MVCQQLETVCAELPPAAVKTGMLFSRAIISAVADFFRRYRRLPLIVDPVLTSTSGARLLETNAVQALQNELLPIATLVTPNLDEAQILAGAPLRSVEDLEPAARIIQARYGCAALVKGGHLRRSREAVDVFYDGNTTLYLSVPFIRGLSTHGTGCTYSAAITAYLALGCNMPSAIRMAKNYLTRAIARSTRIGRYFALNPFWACVLPGHRPPGRFGLAKATARRACQRLSPETQTRRLQI
jgi:hydroxymethylpyrimidine/phosphomethylpyrimidine kinase